MVTVGKKKKSILEHGGRICTERHPEETLNHALHVLVLIEALCPALLYSLIDWNYFIYEKCVLYSL